VFTHQFFYPILRGEPRGKFHAAGRNGKKHSIFANRKEKGLPNTAPKGHRKERKYWSEDDFTIKK
jgi:hypothetical protein